MTAIDWTRYQKCPVCYIPLGEACARLSGIGPNGEAILTETERPHGGRKLRAGYGRG